VKAPDKKVVEKGAKLVWSQSSKILAAVGAFIATVTALLTALNSATWLHKATPTPAPTSVIVAAAPTIAVWGNPPSAYEFDDIVVEVDARQVKGSVDHFYGLVIRDRPEGGGYLFAVSDDGYYAVQILRGDTWEDLVTWTESPALQQGGQVNQLRVESLGPRMRFYANGKLLTGVTDDTYHSGTIGLLAGTSEDEGEVEARFDNLRVQVVRKL